MTRTRLVLASILVLATAAPASAQDRSRSGRARMELAFEHGVALGNESFFVAVADLRLWAPEGLGLVLRTGAGGMPFGGSAFFAEPGVAARVDLVAEEHLGLQLAFSAGATIGRGDIHGARTLYGAWGGMHLDFWHRNAFVGIGAVARYLWTEPDANAWSRSDLGELWSVTPMIRIGGEWGL